MDRNIGPIDHSTQCRANIWIYSDIQIFCVRILFIQIQILEILLFKYNRILIRSENQYSPYSDSTILSVSAQIWETRISHGPSAWLKQLINLIYIQNINQMKRTLNFYMNAICCVQVNEREKIRLIFKSALTNFRQISFMINITFCLILL